MAEIADLLTEQCLIGVALMDPVGHAAAANVVTSADFHEPAHRLLWEAISERYDFGAPVDRPLVYADAVAKGLDRSTALEYLDYCCDRRPNLDHAEAYAERIRDMAGLRAVRELGQLLASTSDTTDLEQVVTMAQDRLDHAIGGRKQSQTFAEGIMQQVRDIEQIMLSGRSYRGVSTGIRRLDLATNGMHRGEMTVLAGQTSQGKSALAMNIACDAAQAGTVLFYSLEMTQRDLYQRILSSRSGVPMYRIRTGTVGLDEFGRLKEVAAWAETVDVRLVYERDLSVSRVQAAARGTKGLALVVVDYLGLMQVGGNKTDNLARRLDEQCAAMKRVALTMDVPVLLVAQLSRAVQSEKDNMPALHHLRDSGGIENNADNVWLIWQKELDKRQPGDPIRQAEATLIIAKQRQGDRGVGVALTWDAEHVRFIDRAEPLSAL